MSIYWLISNDKSRNSERYSLYNVKPENLESPEKMAEDLLSQQKAPEKAVDLVNRYIEIEGGADKRPIKPLSDDERQRRNGLREKLFLNISKTYMDKRKYAEHLERDYGYRYFGEGIMHTTEDAAADKEYNTKVSEYIMMAQNGEFREEALNSHPENRAKLEEFLQMHRDYLKVAKEAGPVLLEGAKNGLTDEFLVENAGIIVKAGLVMQQFSNINEEFSKWGIADKDCSKLMDEMLCYSNYNEHAIHRLGYIASTGYPYISADDAVRVQLIAEEGNELDVPASFETALTSSKTAGVSAFLSEYRCIEDTLVRSGIKREDIEYINPTKNETEYSNDTAKFSSLAFAGHRDLVFTVKGHHDITIPVHISDDMPLTRGNIVQQLSGEKLPKPEKPGFFSRLFNGIHKLLYGTPSKTFREYEYKSNQYETLNKIDEAVKTLKERIPASKDSKEAEAKEKEKSAAPEKQLDVYQQIAKIAKEACREGQTKEDIIKNLTDLTTLTSQNFQNEKVTASGKEISKIISKRIAKYNEGKADTEKIVLDDKVFEEATRLYTYKGNSKNASIDKTIDIPTVKIEKKLSNEKVMGM